MYDQHYSIGIGITSYCNFNCAHCYSRNLEKRNMSISGINKVFEKLPGITSVNFGTGESLLNPDFLRILDVLFERNIKTSLTSNGYSILGLPDDYLQKFNDVDISIDYANAWQNDIFRDENSTKYALDALEKCQKVGVESSIVSCMTNKNFQQIGEMVDVARSYGVNFRVNIYKNVNKSNLNLSYEQFWEGVNILFSAGKIISCSEPIVNTILGVKVLDGGCPCGKSSFRLDPAGYIKPCVYWPDLGINILSTNMEATEIMHSSQWREIRKIPDFCKDCTHLDICKGGCASRRKLSSSIDLPDPYCYYYQGKEKPNLKYEFSQAKDLVHSSYLCTFIME